MKMDWIKNLKPGDKVAVKWSTIHGESYSVKAVKKITPGGKVRLEDGKLFNANGSRVGEKFDWGNSTSIVPYDQKVKDHFKVNRALSVINETDFKKLGLAKLEKIIEIIEGE